MTGIETYEETSTGMCLGFSVTYWDGSVYQTYKHASDTLDSLPGVTSTPNNFIEGQYIVDYRVSPDAGEASLAIAFVFDLDNGTEITCGHIDTELFFPKEWYDIGSCEVIPIGFLSGWVESSPPYLVQLDPHFTTIDSFNADQITTFTIPLLPSWKDITVTQNSPENTSLPSKQEFDDSSTILSAFDSATLPRLTGVQYYESEVDGHCMGF